MHRSRLLARCSALIPLALLLLAGRVLADTNHCVVCGALLSGSVYSVDDHMTGEKQQFCSDCATLRTVCYLCGLPAKTNYTKLADGRIICARDVQTVVLNEADARRIAHETKKSLDWLLFRFMTFPETNLTVAIVDRVHLQELFKFAGYDRVCPNVWGYLETSTNGLRFAHKLSLLSSLPQASLKATAAHEYTHAWLNENLSRERKRTLDQDANEGFCELVAYLLMKSQNEAAQQQLIRRNAYTRGQIDLFIQAEEAYGFHDVEDWVRYGEDGRLRSGELRRVREVQFSARPASANPKAPVSGRQPASPPAALTLRGIYWTPPRPTALINNRTLAVNEQSGVRVGATNVVVRCLSITQDSARIRIADSGEERELRLKSSLP